MPVGSTILNLLQLHIWSGGIMALLLKKEESCWILLSWLSQLPALPVSVYSFLIPCLVRIKNVSIGKWYRKCLYTINKSKERMTYSPKTQLFLFNWQLALLPCWLCQERYISNSERSALLSKCGIYYYVQGLGMQNLIRVSLQHLQNS